MVYFGRILIGGRALSKVSSEFIGVPFWRWTAFSLRSLISIRFLIVSWFPSGVLGKSSPG